jgi:hypothetical protein
MPDLAPSPWRTDVPDDATLRALAAPAEPRPTLSLYLRTDPRDAANAATTPAWLVAARNGLREVTEAVEQDADREARLAWRALRADVEAELEGLTPAQRGRSLVWFLALDGTVDRRQTLQIPVRDHLASWGEQATIAPLIEALDHSRPTGVALVSGERVRLLDWAHGRIDEAGEEVFDLGGDGWRPYRGPSSATPGRGRSGATHVEQVEARMEEHRDRFFGVAARATGRRLGELGWERVIIAAEAPMAARFRDALGEDVAGRVVGELALNAVDAPETEIAQRLEPVIEMLHRGEAVATASRLEADGVAGPTAVLAALAQRQVEHLVLDPYHQPAAAPLSGMAAEVLGAAGQERIGERAVEAAIAGDARITTLEIDASPALQAADGMVAGLRW